MGQYEKFCPSLSEFLQEEMAARGWCDDDVISRISNPLDALAALISIHADDSDTYLDERTANALSEAFGVSAEMLMNLVRTRRGAAE